MHAEVNLPYGANHSPHGGLRSPLLPQQGDTIPLAYPREGTGSDVITIWQTRLHHDGVTWRSARDGA
jgi:hypothetical protein